MMDERSALCERRGTILIVIDGCRPDGLLRASIPHIDSVVQRGASTFSATTVTPAATLPVHFSIFTSLPPEVHGVTHNSTRPMPSPGTMTITERVKASGGRASAFINWEPLRDLAPAGVLVHLLFMDNLRTAGGDLEIASAAATHITERQPDFAFVYLGHVDIAGHNHGFMSWEYIQAIETADAAVGRLLESIELHGLTERYNLILQSDHGGVDHGHHDPVPEVLTVPWIAWGPDVRSGITLEAAVSVLDTAPTLARLLGIVGDESWHGRVVAKLFRDSVAE